MMTGILLGFVSYLIHGFFNFFLDTDKSSALFWGMLAMLVIYDVKTRKKNLAEKA
jgi:hypothetical protein